MRYQSQTRSALKRERVMNKLILALTLALSFTAQAGNVKLCTEYAGTAKTIMNARQNGLELSRMLGIVKSELGQSLVMQAYELPARISDKHKKKAVLRFTDKAMLWCMKVEWVK